MKNSKVVIVLGMHRSGTSLLANWLHHCGVNLGEEYISNTAGNVKGHYEDTEMYNLHRDILASNGTDYLLKESKKLIVKEEHLVSANKIIQERNKNGSQWGWKEPRTCLFLNMWDSLLPDANVIVTFRHFNEVIDSLARRQVIAEKIRRNKILGYYNVMTQKKYWNKNNLSILLNTWIVYNKKILEYLNKKPLNQYIVLNTNKIKTNSTHIINHLNNQWQLGVQNYPIDKVLKPKLMKNKINKYNLDSHLLCEANNILKLLDEMQYHSYAR